MSKEQNRERWPWVAELVDEFVEAFGEVKVEAIYEDGQLVKGKKDEQTESAGNDSRDARVASWGADRISPYWRKNRLGDD